MRRLIQDAVQVKPPLPMSIYTDPTVDPGVAMRAHLPTDTEVRDAMQKLARQVKDTIDSRIRGQEGWKIGDMEVRLITLDRGEVALRGSVVIERADA